MEMIIAIIGLLYLLGSIITAIVLGYIDYNPCFSDTPPAMLLVMFWPITLVVFFYFRLYDLGSYFKAAKDARIARLKLSETSEAKPRPTWLGPSPK